MKFVETNKNLCFREVKSPQYLSGKTRSAYRGPQAFAVPTSSCQTVWGGLKVIALAVKGCLPIAMRRP